MYGRVLMRSLASVRRELQPKTRPCGYPSCGVEIDRSKIGCPHHWWKLPPAIRTEVEMAYRFRARDSRRHLIAVGEAMRWWRAAAKAKADES